MVRKVVTMDMATEDENLTVGVLKQRYGAFDDFEPVSLGGVGLETHDVAGNEVGHELTEER